jgi:hypothetical protein
VATVPVWPLLAGTTVALALGGRAVAWNVTGEPCAPATVVDTVIGPAARPRVQVADA